jgi:predicted transcriptional regulator
MTLTVRLEPELENQLEDYCQAEGTTKSAVVTQALRDFLNTLRQRRTPYEIYREVVAEMGEADQQQPVDENDNSMNYKKRLKDILRAKYGR